MTPCNHRQANTGIMSGRHMVYNLLLSPQLYRRQPRNFQPERVLEATDIRFLNHENLAERRDDFRASLQAARSFYVEALDFEQELGVLHQMFDGQHTALDLLHVIERFFIEIHNAQWMIGDDVEIYCDWAVTFIRVLERVLQMDLLGVSYTHALIRFKLAHDRYIWWFH